MIVLLVVIYNIYSVTNYSFIFEKLECFLINDSLAIFIVFFFRDPHLLESVQSC